MGSEEQRLIDAAKAEMKEQAERDFKAKVKGVLLGISLQQKIMVEAQARIVELQSDLGKLRFEG